LNLWVTRWASRRMEHFALAPEPAAR